jgi:hypothetical protein
MALPSSRIPQYSSPYPPRPTTFFARGGDPSIPEVLTTMPN